MDCPLMNKCKTYNKLYDSGGNQEGIYGDLKENIVDCAYAKFQREWAAGLGYHYICTNYKEEK